MGLVNFNFLIAVLLHVSVLCGWVYWWFGGGFIGIVMLKVVVVDRESIGVYGCAFIVL